ncbi:hypothetical protein K435DRAFT_86343 [Dendrothele bispora CBS 962.96]|uniref:Uncharacterized protein n=1 Tax=Dendrothele bispora (strain CBS 962.96) TaxID=1314807 RepID=A0A4S8M3Q9_DENBC|nr:hypothetical protein K435DRAFT_86343 [Dendrothele bispora CBS 962.96]
MFSDDTLRLLTEKFVEKSGMDERLFLVWTWWVGVTSDPGFPDWARGILLPLVRVAEAALAEYLNKLWKTTVLDVARRATSCVLGARQPQASRNPLSTAPQTPTRLRPARYSPYPTTSTRLASPSFLCQVRPRPALSKHSPARRFGQVFGEDVEPSTSISQGVPEYPALALNPLSSPPSSASSSPFSSPVIQIARRVSVRLESASVVMGNPDAVIFGSVSGNRAARARPSTSSSMSTTVSSSEYEPTHGHVYRQQARLLTK